MVQVKKYNGFIRSVPINTPDWNDWEYMWIIAADYRGLERIKEKLVWQRFSELAFLQQAAIALA